MRTRRVVFCSGLGGGLALIGLIALGSCGLGAELDDYSRTWGKSGDSAVGEVALPDTSCADGWGSCSLQQCDTDLASNPDHCGACRHSCLGGECENGLCKPVVLATDAPGLRSVVAYSPMFGATELYVTNPTAGRILRVSSANEGGIAETLLEEPGWSIVINLFGVYFTNQDTGEIRTVSQKGGDAGTFYKGQGKLWGLAQGPGGLYWSAAGSEAGVVMSQNFILGAPTPVASNERQPRGPVVDETHAYWAALSSPNSIRTADLDSGKVSTLGTWEAGFGEVYSLALDDQAVYFSAESGFVGRVDKADGGIEQLLESIEQPRGVALEGDTVFYTSYSGGQVGWVSKSGAKKGLLATDQARPWGIAVDSSAVYWVDHDDGTIRKIAKP